MLKFTIKLVALLALLWLPRAHAAITISSASILPMQEHTQMTLESKQPVRYNLFVIKNPERLVIDLEDVEINDLLNNLARLISNNNPYIKSVRVGRFKPGVVRLVFGLKKKVKPQLSILKPDAEYGYRLVLDIYPAVSTVAQTKPDTVHGKHKDKGVPQDDAEAVKRIRLAAEQGDAKAQFNLGEMYEQGKGVTQDYTEAVKWYRLSAEMQRKPIGKD